MGLGAPRRKTDRTRHCSGWSCGPQPGPGRTPPSQNLPAVRANRLNTNGSRGSRPAKCCSGACQTAAHRALHRATCTGDRSSLTRSLPLRRTDQLNERPGRLGVVGLIVATAPGRGARGAVVDGGRRLDPLCTACSYSARTWAGGAPFGGGTRRLPDARRNGGDLPTTGWSGWLPPALSTRFYAGAACRVDVPGPGGAARSAASGWAKRP